MVQGEGSNDFATNFQQTTEWNVEKSPTKKIFKKNDPDQKEKNTNMLNPQKI